MADVLCVSSLLKNTASVQKWLSEKKEGWLFVLEEELFAATTFKPHPREKSVYKSDKEGLKQLAWQLVFLQVILVDHSSLGDAKKKEIEEIYAEFNEWKLGVDLVASDYRERGVPQWKNLFANCLYEAKRGRELFGKFEGVPAIICGAGPSLDRSLHKLTALQDKALLFAGGSALALLSKAGVVPHFAAAIDPDPPLHRALQDSSFEAPFFYQDRLSREVLKRRHSPLLWVEGSGGFPIEEWLRGEGTFDGGWNVATFCTALAVEMGCNPIVFVGVDLIDEKGIAQRDWVIADQWLKEYAKAHPEKTFVKIENAAPLEKQWDLPGRIHAVLEQIPNMAPVDKEAQVSLQRCAQKCEELLRMIEKAYPQLPFDKGEFVLHEVELEEQIVYQTFLEPVWKIWEHVFVREMSGDLRLGLYLNKLLFMRQICHELSNP